MLLTDEQRDAVERRGGSLFLHAGAGSGKTRVLVERFVRAVLDDGVRVDQILAITFTEKAAAELKGRLRRRFLELGERERAREAEAAWVSTIHGFCSRVLRANPLRGRDRPRVPGARRGRCRAPRDRRLRPCARGLRSEGALRRRGATRPRRLLYPRQAAARWSPRCTRLRSQGKPPALPPLDPPVVGDERSRLERALAAARARLGSVDANKTVTAALAQVESCSKALRPLADDALGDAADIDDGR